MKNKFLIFSAVAIGGFMLAGCQLYNPATESQLYQVQMQLKQAEKIETITARNKIDSKQLQKIAKDWKKTSDDVMLLQMVYNNNIKGQSTRAIRVASSYKRALRDFGVSNIKIEMKPNSNYKGNHPQVKIKYNAWKTATPIGCEGMYMPGYYGAEMPDYPLKYKMGCSSETMIGKMVARPKDLLGKEGLPSGDSRREGSIVENYKAGVPNERMEGISVGDTSSSGGG